MVWIPSIKTLYGSDVLFNQAHPFTCEVTAEERQQWIRDIERLEKMGAEVIIPGHQKPGMPFDSSSFSFTKDYLIATEEEIAKTKDEGCFYYAMVQHFPEANLFISNEMNAGVFKGGRNWNWKDEEQRVPGEAIRRPMVDGGHRPYRAAATTTGSPRADFGAGCVKN